MITQQDLQAAIAECLGERNPNANTCIKLAAFYTIRDQLYPEDEPKDESPRGYSYAPPPEQAETTIQYSSDTEFGRLIEGKPAREIWPIIDELVSNAVQTLSPRLYGALIRKIQS